MAVVYLARHGQASFGANDYDVLSERGHEQARVLGLELARRGVVPDVVVSGTLKRQQDTARVAVEALGDAGVDSSLHGPEWDSLDGLPDLTVDERWNEYDHVGLLGHHLAENRASLFVGAMTAGRARTVQRALDGALARWLEAGDCEECVRPWPRFAADTAAALDDLLDQLGSGGVGLVVTSGGVIAATAMRLLDLSPTGFVQMNRVVVNASLTKVVHGRSGISLLSLNDHAHFEGPHRNLLTYR